MKMHIIYSTVHEQLLALSLCKAVKHRVGLGTHGDRRRSFWAGTTGNKLEESQGWYQRLAAGDIRPHHLINITQSAIGAVLSAVAVPSIEAVCYWAASWLPAPLGLTMKDYTHACRSHAHQPCLIWCIFLQLQRVRNIETYIPRTCLGALGLEVNLGQYGKKR